MKLPPELLKRFARIQKVQHEECLLFYGLILGFLFGVALRSLVFISTYGAFFIILLSISLGCVSIRNGKKIFIVACSLAACGIGILRFSMVDLSYQDNTLNAFVDQKVILEGVVVDEPAHKSNRQQFILESIGFNGVSFSSPLRTVVVAESYPRVSYGDKVRVSGNVKYPLNFENDITKRSFNYVNYLRKDRVGYQMLYPHVEILSSHHGNPLREKLFMVKSRFLGALRASVSEPHASLLGGVTVGARESLGENLEEEFRKTGIIHIVVLSDYNVSIVAEYLMKVLSFAPSAVQSVLGIGSMILFTLFTGASATIIRATLMASLVIISKFIHRTYAVERALLLSACIMVAENPFILLFDPSFELSFLATLGLISFSPVIEQKLSWLSYESIKSIVSATLSTQIMVLPLLLYMTGEMSLLSLPVNVLVLPVIPFLMLLGLAIGVLGFIHSLLGTLLGSVAYVVSSYVFQIVDVFSHIPFTSVSMPFFNIWFLIFSYGLISMFLFLSRKKELTQKANSLRVEVR